MSSPGISYGTEPATSRSFSPVEGLQRKYSEHDISKKLATNEENKSCFCRKNPSSDRINVSDDTITKSLKKKNLKKKVDSNSLPSESCSGGRNLSPDRTKASEYAGMETLKQKKKKKKRNRSNDNNVIEPTKESVSRSLFKGEDPFASLDITPVMKK